MAADHLQTKSVINVSILALLAFASGPCADTWAASASRLAPMATMRYTTARHPRLRIAAEITQVFSALRRLGLTHRRSSGDSFRRDADLHRLHSPFTLSAEHQLFSAGRDVRNRPRRCATCAARRNEGEGTAGVTTWVFIEDRLGFIQPGSAITHLLADDGALLAETAPTTFGPEAALPSFTPGAGRLLRYYFGRGGRRVVVLDDEGLRWPASIIRTRWGDAGRYWFVSRWEPLRMPLRGRGRETSSQRYCLRGVRR